MERARHRNSKSATGIQQIQKQKAVSRFYSDSHSCTGGITRDDMSSSRKNTGTPMKKLPAEKMPKEVETKRLSPSVIARLMGLNGLPPPRRADKQQTRLSDSYQQKNVSMSIRKNGQLNNGRSIRRSSTEHREFKDVYEDMTTSRFVNRRYSSRWSASPRLMKPEIAPIQQKFLDAKRLSTVEKLQGSKEFDDTLEMLDSNKDLLLKFLEQPDSLFVKHLHDMQVDPSSSLRSHLPDLEPSNSARYESNIKPWKSERDVSCKYDINSLHKHEDGLFLHLYSHCRAHISRKSSKIHLEERNGKNILPTRIVVLKPNLRKMHSAGTSALSTDYAHDYLSNCRRVKERPSFGGDETLSRKRKISSNDGRFSKPMSREAREIAREITRRMRDGCDGVIDQMFPRVRGYGGDESSYDANGSDSTTESEVFKLPSRNSFCMNNRHKYSSSGLIESSVSRDRKKRLSERREATWRCQDAEGIGKGSKLGKMLGMPDREIRPKHLNAMLGLDGASDRAASMNGSPLWDGPLGISSSVRTLSRSRSLPSSSFSRRNHIRNAQCEVLSEDPYLMLSGTSRGTSKFVKANTSWNEYLSM
ncbi:hypothetical protein Fot_33010 [Forsythia ovata]|uniref:DUF3741 domain-containing protein n=1 Tax=Forsythia ovata TaxID=205694 RepID=A0ABD1TA01_9LAMI